ncbi:MAG: phenylalanine--tRNA ligase subunit beta [Candidatus Omnitrophica bacterium]|nr:phenylalanine--tRNA ligase subunit beta [Candidatus Omnitrophota bacterium]
MKLTYNWLNDFVEIKLPPKELCHTLTMAGLEVVSLEEKEGDFVLEIEITSNRPDWLSVVGIAREVAAITGAKLRQPKHIKQNTLNIQPPLVTIENKKDCPFYSARVIQGVTIGSSPDWLARRLAYIGCRGINNVVDITNYVLFTWGEPLHAFDVSRLENSSIVVRRAHKEEKLICLDGHTRTLNDQMLVIATGSSLARSRAVAVAGIMGGEESQVSTSTTRILLEAAVFDPVLIRRTKRTLGMQTDSAYRFERGVDMQTAEFASGQACRLITEIAGGKVVGGKTVKDAVCKKKMISLKTSFVNSFLGIRIPGKAIKKYLSPLGFELKPKSKDVFSVGVPSFRQDVRGPADLVEEIARIHGFEKIPKTLPQIKPHVEKSPARDMACATKDILVGLGLQEVITYSLTDKALLKCFAEGADSDPIEIRNPLSKEQAILRSTLLPSLGRCIAYNLNQKQEHVAIFEIAKVYLFAGTQVKETLALGIALCGARRHFLDFGSVREDLSLLHLKGAIETLFSRLGIRGYAFTPSPHNVVEIMIGRERMGRMRPLTAQELVALDIKNADVFVLELLLEKVFPRADLHKRFIPVPKYPAISRDISFVMKEETLVDEVVAMLRMRGAPLLRDITVIDYYKGKQIPHGSRGMTFSCTYRSEEKTLTESEILPLHKALCESLVSAFGATLR